MTIKAEERAARAAERAAKAEERAARAEEAAEAARLAEEAAEQAREAARLAQIAAEEAEEEGEEPEDEEPEAPTSSEKPEDAPEASGDTPDDEDASESGSEAPEAADAPVKAEEDEDAKPAKSKRLSLKKTTKAKDGDEPRRRSRLGGLSTVIAVLVVLTVALGAGTVALWLKVNDQKATETASKEATFASTRAAQKLSSYDYQTLDTDLKAASATTTGKLHTQYDKLAQQLKTVAVQQQAVSNTTVMKVGVVSASPDKVVTLVYANRSSATKNDKQQRLPEPLRIKMTMVKVDGKWLASELTVLS
ncbi:hypothetical protein E1293_11270 [Actinomadura darangshiensis]|uniref:Mce-associated membrane protein n=1 Tax=Actinomadura darangshiensis TaxID=705336 RepID=A0A4R5BN32_9ACTN|nr:hypothetical protein [Actinomadura darangshiensis]TDD85362.1 hypothetical protein E1293_11270 [Actinomadura darangshiensis]